MSNIQFSLFDNSGNQSGSSSEIAWIDIDRLHPHPDNPRLIYREDIIETIANSIKESGFQPCYALLVRPFGDGYQVVSGHTRLKASQKVGVAKLPCWIKDLDDETAFMELVLANNQGELSPLEYGMHVLKYVELSEGGRGKKGGIRGYASTVSKDESTIRGWRDAALVAEFAGKCGIDSALLIPYSTHLKYVRQVPEPQYWQQLTDLLIENEWSVKETEHVVNSVKSMMELNCPEWLSNIIKFDQAVNTAIKGDPRICGTMKSCIDAAVKCYESLEVVTVKIVDGDELREEMWDMPSMYVKSLSDTKNIHQNLTPGNFTRPYEKLKALVEKLEEKANQWEISKAEGAELERLKAEQEARIAQLTLEYKPEGILGDVKKVLPRMIADHGDTFDLILTDPPYLLSNDGITARGNKQVSVNKNFDDSKSAIAPESWLPFCLQLLKPGGVLAFTCTEHLDISLSRLESHGFEFLERLFWIKRSAPPRLTPTGHRACVEEIWVCRKPGDTHTFNYDLLKDEYWNGKQASNYLEFEQCSGNERLGWHDTQKPLKLWSYLMKAYSPEGGKVLDPFSGSGTTAVAAKQLLRKCTWVEQDPTFYHKAQDRIDSVAFPWEA